MGITPIGAKQCHRTSNMKWCSDYVFICGKKEIKTYGSIDGNNPAGFCTKQIIMQFPYSAKQNQHKEIQHSVKRQV